MSFRIESRQVETRVVLHLHGQLVGPEAERILREQIRHIRSRLKTLNQNFDAPVPLHPNLGDIDFWSFVRRE